MTASQFQAGFESTRDSDVLITGITTMPGGQPAADVTFTSRQQPQDGPDGESCTNWHVTMYFDGSAGTYTIGAPPNGYKAAYQACSGLSVGRPWAGSDAGRAPPAMDAALGSLPSR